jgi:hypothetical protein
MVEYTKAVSGQQFSKHVSVARQQVLNNETVELQKWKTAISTWCTPRCYKQGTRSVDSSLWESVKRGLEPGGTGIAIVGCVTRTFLVTD